MANAVTIEATYGDGKTLDVLSDLIRRRVDFLKETTEQAVTATVINILKSIRSRTRVANPKDKAGVLVAHRPDLIVSWSMKGGKRRLCIRCGTTRGPHYNGRWYTTHKPEISKQHAFFVRDIASSKDIGTDKVSYVLVANNEQEARDYALARHVKRVQRYAGLAKNLLGVLMHKVSEGQGDTPASSLLAAVIGKTAEVQKVVQGFASGCVMITVGDMLDYAVPAIKGGEATVTLAMQKAANATAAIINRVANLPLSQQIASPFPH